MGDRPLMWATIDMWGPTVDVGGDRPLMWEAQLFIWVDISLMWGRLTDDGEELTIDGGPTIDVG